MQRVESREYKLMLRAPLFKGDEDKLIETVTALWSDLAPLLSPYAISVSDSSDLAHKRREVRFLDTGKRWLRSNDYVLRERIDTEKGERKVTLKFRHPDRYISQDRDMSPADGLDEDIKFEEDIKPEFLKLYSFSSDVFLSEEVKLATLADVQKLFPGLPDSVDAFPASEELFPVGDFIARERVIEGIGFQIRKDPEVNAKCSLAFWYSGKEDEAPVVAEFSFKYEDAQEAYTGRMARCAFDAFLAIQSGQGEDWVDPNPTTKTAYVYALDT